MILTRPNITMSLTQNNTHRETDLYQQLKHDKTLTPGSNGKTPQESEDQKECC